MPPNKHNVNDADIKSDIADIKASLEFICKSVDELKQSNGVNEKKINDILSAMKLKDERINELERRVNDLEQHSRKRNIIVTGLNVHSYAHAATRPRSTRGSANVTDGEDVSESNEMRKNFVKFAQDKLNVSVEEIEITAIHDLPKRKDGTTPVIVQLSSVDKKTDLMRKRKCLKGSNVFLNDQLTKVNNDLFAEARRLKRENKLYGTWTMNCNIYVKKTEHDKKVQIKCKGDLETF